MQLAMKLFRCELLPSEIIELLAQAAIAKDRVTTVVAFEYEIPLVILVVLPCAERTDDVEPEAKNIQNDEHDKDKCFRRVQHSK